MPSTKEWKFIKGVRKRLWATLIAIDQMFAAVIVGHPDETLSAIAYREALDSKLWAATEVFINLLFFFDYEERDGRKVRHCELAWEAELTRKHLPSEYVRGRR